MKYLINDLYFESIRELEKLPKSRFLISERVALEKALAKLDAIKKILNYCTVTPKQ